MRNSKAEGDLNHYILLIKGEVAFIGLLISRLNRTYELQGTA
jgi:hypothetical protein